MSNEHGKELAEVALDIRAIKLNPDDPFQWASGYRMPIYNDNRLFLGSYEYREIIANGFLDLIEDEGIEWRRIAGTSTAGISPATTLADLTGAPLIYVRDKPKDHGLRNRIEGIDSESDLEGEKIILIEDLISTGGSSASAVQAIRDANGVCDYCLSIFNYGLDKAERVFRGEEAFDRDGNKLSFPCNVRSLLDYETLLEVAVESAYIDEEQVRMLNEWRADPFGWGEKNGFPRIEKVGGN